MGVNPDSRVQLSTVLGFQQSMITASAVDAAGNIYVGGLTNAHGLATPGAVQQSPAAAVSGFLAKLSPDTKEVLYFTYFGGSASDAPAAMKVDSVGNLVLAGRTSSRDFPLKNPALLPPRGYPEAWVAKLNGDGTSLVFATYLGGLSIDGASGLALDSEDNIYVTGETQSADFPLRNALKSTKGGLYDAFLTKMSPQGSILFSTYLGGSDSDRAMDIVTDAEDNLSLTGFTSSEDFPIRNGVQAKSGGGEDCFLIKLNAQGSEILYSTYLGGGQWEECTAVAVDGVGNTYIAGVGVSADSPLITSVTEQGSLLAAKISREGQLVYAMRLGGSNIDQARRIVADGEGAAYIAGQTYSGDFPTMNALRPFSESTLFESESAGETWRTAGKGLLNQPCRAIVFDPGEPGTVYCSTDRAVWRRAAGEEEWKQLDLGVPGKDLRVTGLRTDQKMPCTLFVGFVPPPDSGIAYAVLKSMDGGKTWQPLPSGVQDIVATGRQDTNLLYGKGGGGLLRSRDGGETWETIPTPALVQTLELDPRTDSKLYMVAGSELYISVDAGGTWQKAVAAGRRLVDVRAHPSGSGLVYAAGNDGVFRSDDGGDNWQPVNAGLLDRRVLSLALDPANVSMVYAGTYGTGLFRSTDGGASWQVCAGVPNPRVFALAVDAQSGKVLASGIYLADVFLVRIAPESGELEFATLWGGSGEDTLAGMGLGWDGTIQLTGTTSSADFPLEDSRANMASGTVDGFVVKVSASQAGTCCSGAMPAALSEKPEREIPGPSKNAANNRGPSRRIGWPH